MGGGRDMNQLVLDYLVGEGYIEAARSFVSEAPGMDGDVLRLRGCAILVR